MRTKTRYIVRFDGVLESGYVKYSFIQKSSERKISGKEEGIKFATKFRFEWCAKLFAWVSNGGYDLREYRVHKIEIVKRHQSK